MLLPFLLNWYVNPYHASIAVAKEKGYYEEFDIDLCLLEPNSPSEVTKIVGEGLVPLGLKAMVHCFAARSRGYPVKSIGTILDEPPTGLIAPVKKEIHSIEDIRNKRLGYVGQFGKVMIDELAQQAGIASNEYQTIRTGMDASGAIIRGEVDAAIGISCFQQLEVEEAGIETNLLRIDEAANLGCCCFCSIMMIGHEEFLEKHPGLTTNLMQATRRGAEFVREQPDIAFELLTQVSPRLKTPLYQKIFHHTLPFVSKDCRNVERDWEKVGKYAQRLGILDDASAYRDCYSNKFIDQVVEN